MTEPTKSDPDYYPRIKIGRRWYLIVPETHHHEGCAFELCGGYKCKLVAAAGGDDGNVPLFDRHDCGENGTIFVAPAKFPEYLATLAANKLESKT